MMDYATLLQILDSTVRLATPLLLACIAGLYSERSGVFDIGLEGKMLVAAMSSAAVAFYTGNAWIGALAGIAGSMAFALIHGVTSITFRGNQLIAGVALNFLASGVTVLVAKGLFNGSDRTPQLAGAARFDELKLPFAEYLGSVQLQGSIASNLFTGRYFARFYSDVLSGHSILVYAAFAIVALTWWVLYRTRYGLRLRAVGENPAAVDTAGVSVKGLRFSAVMITGVLCGLAGAYMATALQAGFGKEMTAGRGYIALAALIFAKWRPVAAMYACLLFGFFQALALRPDVVEAVVQVKVPVPFLDALPYILTVIVLAGFIGKAIPPRAGGEPYVKER
jgi:general nucleoside transport system permease protein